MAGFFQGRKATEFLNATEELSGISLDDPSEALYVLTMGVAEGRTDKAAVTAEFDRIVRSQV